jgi:gliding motility-associated-like protein
MKIKRILFCLFSMLLNDALGQYTSDASLNTLVSSNSSSADLSASAVSMCTNKTYIAFNTGSEIRVQLLDADGNKMFGSEGVLLTQYHFSYTMVFQISIKIDANDNALIALTNLDVNTGNSYIDFFVVNNKGKIVKNEMASNNGMNPILTPLHTGEFILAWTNGGQTGIQIIDKKFNFKFPSPKTHHDEVSGICVLPDNQFYMVLNKDIQVVAMTITTVMLFDSDANPQWPLNVQLCSHNASSVPTAKPSLALSSSNELYVSNSYFDGGFADRNPRLQCIDLTGAIKFGIDGIQMKGNSNLNYHQRTQLSVDAAGNIIVVYEAKFEDFTLSYPKSIYMHKFTPSGNSFYGTYGKILVQTNTDPFFLQFQPCGQTYKMAYFEETTQNIKLLEFDTSGAALGTEALCLTSDKRNYSSCTLNQPNDGKMIFVFNGSKNGNNAILAQRTLCFSEKHECNQNNNTDKNSFFIPNVFTPNGDGYNDEFELVLEGYEVENMMIFNRWGEKIFVSSDKAKKWDGSTTNGALASPSTYYYQIKLKQESSNEISNHQGFIMLLN